MSDRFSLSWDSVLVSSDSVIVARLDGRGSGYQGQRILHEVHQRLGTVDVQDQIAAIEFVSVFTSAACWEIPSAAESYSFIVSVVSAEMFRCSFIVGLWENRRVAVQTIGQSLLIRRHCLPVSHTPCFKWIHFHSRGKKY